MSKNTYILTSDGELYHWKYIKREKINGKWRYYYDLPGAKNSVKSAVSNVWNKIRSATKKQYKSTKSKIDKVISSAAKKIKTVADKVENAVTRAKKRVYKYIAKIPVGDTFRYFYSDAAYKAYLNGKNAVDATVNKLRNREVGTLIDDAVKDAGKNVVTNLLKSGFGQAMYKLVLPAFTALQVALQTPESFDEIKRIDSEQTNDEDQKTINPDYDPTKLDYSYNCSFCTAAYDLRKRGYDVEAMPISTLEGPVIDDILSWYQGAEAVSESSVTNKLSDRERHNTTARAKALSESLESYGDGARGHLCMYWSMGGGHDIVWSVEDGEVVYRDCQTNETYDMSQLLTYVDDYSYVRVDNCEPTEEVLRTVRNRED